ncbi:YbaN family protein [Pontibaca methylaminivorans]|uniref:Inner membrane protein n=1 Tax=Pontibaca methylaminivorans TaxID=515897 RepID=A0A1R3WUA0_9RHOB|nr:YbaN family protein [Pontibaca methylaminivorans]SIT82014.1 hypothetical protein SAMN05421849_1599 [Pontibaca methylaminivorans]
MSADDPEPPSRPAVSRWLWTVGGWGALALGAAGVVLPVLPTTPFVLLAAYMFGKGSPRLRAWLLAHRIFGPLTRDWEERGAIPRRAKILAVSVMALTFVASIFMGFNWVILTIQAVALSGAGLYVVTRPDA